MPRLDVVVESPVAPSFRVEAVRGMFDLPPDASVRHEWHLDAPVESRDWQVGLVVGPSGSGKSTLGRALFPDAYHHAGYDWPGEAAVVDGFPPHLDTRAVTAALSAVGFSSPPHWLKRFSHLSNGQKFRCELARLMLGGHGTAVVDEWTSVIDRDAAKVSSAAVAKAVRSLPGAPRLVALSCHYDVLDWLDPEWVLNTADGTFAWRSLQGRPKVRLEVRKAGRGDWAVFRDHHYLSHDINRAAECYVATWDDAPVGFASWIHFPHASFKNGRRAHRFVVLPDYQGVGVGSALLRWAGSRCKAEGFRFFLATGHPALIRHCSRSRDWKTQEVGHTRAAGKTANGRRMAGSSSRGRITGSFEYAGPAEIPD